MPERTMVRSTTATGAPVGAEADARPPAIETRGLRKVYGEKVAVEDVTITVPEGEVFGFLGPNGAGKSTTMKMLLGLAFPTSGSARLLGHPLGATSPSNILTEVLLPAPFGPRKPKTSPSCT